jgi:pyruvate formate lyase activating enzyme
VTAGYITDDARPEFYQHMDAANVDFKAFTDAFYHRLCFAQLQPVLDTLKYLRHETNVWFEVTTLLIPGENDSDAELHRASEWFMENLGPHVPWHFTRSIPISRCWTKPTPPATFTWRAKSRVQSFTTFTGNVHDREGGSTWVQAAASYHRARLV